MPNNIENLNLVETDLEFLNRELSSRISVSRELKKFILIGFINRTNTGALTTALGHVEGVTRHIQPIKAIARGLMESRGQKSSTPLEFLKDTIEIGSGIQLVKETIGPNLANPAEWLDSLNLFLKSGVQPQQTCFIPTFRDPISTIASWRRMWGFNIVDFPFRSFNQSFSIVDNTIDRSKSLGITVVPYVHELTRDHNPEVVIKNMCSRLGIPFNPSVLNWESEAGDPYFNGQLIKYDLPPDAWVQGALSLGKGGRGGLVWRPVPQSLQLTKEEVDFVLPQIQPATEIHDRHVALTKQLLKL